MKKIIIRRPGAPSRLRLESVEPPEPKRDEVLVRVEAIGVNYADCVARMGLYRSSWETVGWPLTPGFEIAGRIVGRGAVAGDLQIGERVVCITRFGGYAEMVAVPAHQAFRFTEQLSMALAASLPVSFITALHALDLAAASPGAAILVHSAAGAAGLAIVQAARHLNLRIFGVVGSIDKVETSLGAGADVVVMRTRGWDDEARRFCSEGFAAVFDAGGDTLRRSYALVAPLGRLIIYGSHGIVPTTGRLIDVPRVAFRYALMPRFGALALSNSNRSVMGFNLSYLFDRSDLMRTMMKRVMTMLEQRAIVPLPVERFRLSDAKAAHYRLHSGRTVGKLVLIPDSMW